MASYSYHYTATGGNFCKRVEEKEELQKISDRFAAYIARVRQLREEKSAQIDTASFLRATQILEEEIRSLKALYESELEKIRREGDGFKKEYSSLHIQYERSCQLSKELQERLDAERGKNGSLSQEIGRLRSHVSQLELKYREAYEGASKPNAELEKLRGDLKKALRELEAANVRYEQEVLARQDGDNKAKGALEKMRIAAQVHAKELADWKARLDAANATILEMEKKLKFKGGDVNVQAMIKQVRDAADAELNKFKIDTNEKYAQNCGLLKKQIEEYAALIDRLTKEKQQALDLAEDLRLRNSKLEGQMTSFRSEIGVLEAQITQERRASAAQLQALNMKMKEFQDKMFARINISGGTSSDNVMLKAEIEALKAILEQAESGLFSSGGMDRPSTSLPGLAWKSSGANFASSGTKYAANGGSNYYSSSSFLQKAGGGSGGMGFTRISSSKSNTGGGTYGRSPLYQPGLGSAKLRTEYNDSYRIRLGRRT